MAYVSGTAATFAELVAGIRNACTANGWTLSGEVLHKGTVYQRVRVNGNFIDSKGGTGIDGSNALTGESPSGSRIGSNNATTLIFPLTYEVFVHTNPDEVMVVISYGSDAFQWFAFGKSAVTLPGTGGWHSGSLCTGWPVNVTLRAEATVLPNGYFGYRDSTSSGEQCPAMFWASSTENANGENANGEHIHTGLNGATWEGNLKSSIYRAPLNAITPNAYNNQAVLLPIQVFSTIYGSSKVALVLDVAHCRSLSIANLNPGEIITLGTDRWKVFPWFMKNSAEGIFDYTGKHGFAVRYDGP